VTKGRKKNGERRKLGRNQESLLRAMIDHGGTWGPGLPWSWGPRSETRKVLAVLEARGCVRKRGSQWAVTAEGRASLGDEIEETVEAATQDTGILVGRRIVSMRPMTKSEASREGWSRFSGSVHGLPPVLELDNGTLVYPARDYEGNGPGALLGIMDGQRMAFTYTVEDASNHRRTT